METDISKNMPPVMYFEADGFQGMMVSNGKAVENCRNTIINCLDAVLKRHKAFPVREPVTIADIGTADGRSSLQILNDVIGRIQSTIGQNQPIQIYYTDQAESDFNLLFRVMQGQEDVGVSGLKLGPQVFPAVIGRTMYEQCLPDESVDIALSSIVTMTLSKRPCKIKGGVTFADADEEEKAIIKEQSRKDWKQFLMMRGRELKPGGYLVILNIGTYDDHVNAHNKGGDGQLSHILYSMFNDGIISQEEYLNTNQNADIYRTKEEHKQPFEEKDPEIIELGLELVSVRAFLNTPLHPITETAEKDDTTKKAYADAIVAGIKPWFYHVIYNGLSTARSSEDRRHIVDLYFSKVWDFAFINSDFKPVMPLIEVVIKKSL